MASEVRVNTITNRSGLSTVTFGAYGIEFVGITTVEQLNVSSGVSNINATGVSTFAGNIDANGDLDVEGHTELDNVNIAGVLTATSAEFSGNVTVLGDLTYENVTNQDSIGIATARAGLRITGGGLEVTGVSTFSSDISIADKIIHTGDTNTAIRFPANDTFTVETGGSERLRINPSGNFLLNGGTIFGDDGATNTLTIQSTSGNNNHSKILIGINEGSDNGGIHMYTAGSSVAERRITIKGTSGNIGIGTDNPLTKLHLSSGTATQIMISNISSTMSDGDTIGTIDFAAGPSNTVNARVAGLVEGTSEAGGDLVFETRADGGSLLEKLRITSSGSVGIGTDNPASILHLLGTAPRITFTDTAGTDDVGKIFSTGGALFLQHRDGAGHGEIIFRTENSSTAVERLRITADGKVRVPDNGKFTCGTGDDLQLFQNGSNSFIDNSGGGFYLRQLADDADIHLQSDNGSGGLITYIQCVGSTGAVNVAHYGLTKLTTTSTGIDVTGTVTCDGLSCVGAATIEAASGNLKLKDSDGTGGSTSTYVEGIDSTNSSVWYVGHGTSGDSALYVSNQVSGDINFRTGAGTKAVLQSDGHFRPQTNNNYDLGTSSLRWRNVYTNDLNLSNEGSTNDVDGTWGNYTIQEGEEDLFLINRRSGKKYKFMLQEVE